MCRHIVEIFSLIVFTSGCATTALGPSVRSGRPAPDFSLPTLDGRQISLAEFHGKVVVLDFWATWCPPCRQSLPHLARLAADAEMARKGLTVLAVNEREDPATIRTFLEQNHYAFKVVQDADGSVARSFGASTLPTTIVIGRDAVVRAVYTGWTDDIARRIDQAVAESVRGPATST